MVRKGREFIILLIIIGLMACCCLAGCGESEKGKTSEAPEPEKRTIVDMAGRENTVPAQIDKVFYNNPTGAILTYTLDPDMMVGWTDERSDYEKKFILPECQDLPNLGGWYAKNTCNVEELLKLQPDVIIHMEPFSETVLAKAEDIQEQTGIPVIMMHSDLDKLPEVYEFAGKLLNREERADELKAYCEETLEDIQSKANSIPEDQRVMVYYAEGAKGLQTDPEGSIHTQVLDMVGGINVAKTLTKGGEGMASISVEQLLSWDPDVIMSWNRIQGGYYDKILTDSKWTNLTAVKNKKVYAVPTGPFNWFERPPSVTRLMGLKWLGNLLYPDVYQYDMVKETKEFFKKFYYYDITDEEVAELLKDSGGI